LDAGETCDDGNYFNSDGWDSNWHSEIGYLWTGTSPQGSIWTINWGDGIKLPSELWEDGNLDNLDGWDSSWNVELGWICFGGTISNTDTCADLCGDGTIVKMMSSQYWDDGNTVGGDGWDSTCYTENGWKCTSSLGVKSVWIKLPQTEDSPIFDETFQIQVLSGAAMAGSALTSTLSMSSPNGVWQTMNIMQLFMIMLLLGVYLPPRIENLITSVKFLFSFFKIPFLQNLYFLKDIFRYLDYEQTNPSLEKIGVESGSTLNNISTEIFFYLLIIFVHVCAIPLKYCSTKEKKNMCSDFFISAWKKVWTLLTFNIYLRVLLQCSQFWIISSVSELFNSDLSTLPKTLSFSIAGIVSAFMLWFWLFWVYLYVKKLKNNNESSDSRTEELFSGLKKSKYSRIYNLLLLARKFVMLTFVICFQFLPTTYYLIYTSLLQLVHLIFVAIVRPFSRVKDNLVETTSEMIFFVMVTGLIYFNEKDKWSDEIITTYAILIMFPGFFVWVLSIGKFFNHFRWGSCQGRQILIQTI
jgi:cysteine-rich repeat protein